MNWHNRDFEDVAERLYDEYDFRVSLTPGFKSLYVEFRKWLNPKEVIEITSVFTLKVSSINPTDEELYLLLKPLIEAKIKKIKECLKPNE